MPSPRDRNPPPVSSAWGETFEGWRERLLTFLLVASAVAALPSGVAASIAAYRQGQSTLPLLYLAAFALVAIMALAPRLPSLLRAAVLLAIPYGLGMQSLLASGPAGSGYVFLVAFTVAAAILFGLRGGLIAWALSLAGYLTASLVALPTPADPAMWISRGITTGVLSAAFAIAFGLLQDRLARALGHQQEWVERAGRERSELEARVAAGTRGLMRQAVQLQTTAEIARLVTQKVDPQTLLSRAAELIQEQFGFYHASVFLVDQTGTWAELAASTGEVGRSLVERNFRLAVGSASLIGWATANRLTRVALDVETDPFYFRNPLLPDTRAEVAVPLVVGDRLLGALDVHSAEPQAFGQDDVRAIEAIASELAIALDSARQLQEARLQLEDAQGVVRGRVRASWSRLTQHDLPETIRVAPSGETLLGGLGALPSMTTAEQTAQPFLTEDGHEIAVPVLVRGEVVASIGVRRPGQEERWAEDDIALLLAIAGQAALALETARQTAEEQRRLAELEVLNRVSQAVSQMLRLDSLFRVVHAQIDQVLGDVDLTFAFYDSVTGELARPYVSQGGEETDVPPAPLGDDLVSYVVRSQTPLLLSGELAGQAAQLGVHLGEADLRSWLGVPMMVGQDVVGAIAVEDRQQENRFTDDDSALLSTIASQVAAGLQNARLLEQVQRAARRERLIHEIATKVRRSGDFRSILETTTRELSRALNASRASVSLGPGDGDGHPAAEAPTPPSPQPPEDGS